MRKQSVSYVVLALLAAGLLWPANVYPWGTRAMRSVTGMALQVLKYDFPTTFRPGGVVGPNFERDVMSGASDGWQVLARRVPLNSDSEVIEAVASEIQLLREARRYGPTPYFAYRMGALGSLVAHAMLPYGFSWTSEEHDLRRQIVADIERHIDGFDFRVPQRNREFIRNAQDYFRNRRSFHAEDKRLIAHDYKVGLNYEGFMKQGGKAYFVRSVEAVADVWNTVLRADVAVVGFTLEKPSPRTLTWYFVDEMEYLLNVKNNMFQVETVYGNFERVNPRLVEAYEELGDIFYANEDRAVKLRGVAEWQKAYDLGGPERSRIGRKLSGHYLREGQAYLSRAGQPEAEDTDLNNALNAFERALNFDRTSDIAAEYIHDTHVAIRERNERLEVALSIIATGERIHEEANRYRDAGDFANAISTYRQSIGFFEAIDDEFRQQEQIARERIRRLRREIEDAIRDVIDTASQAVDEGDRARDRNLFDEAANHYQRIPAILAVIPDDESPTVARDKQELLAMADRRLEETNIQRLRYEQALEEQPQAQQ